jgi:hypothetical protein
MLLAVLVVAPVARSIRPSFETLSVLFVSFPPALVARAIQVAVGSVAVSFVIFPVSVVHVSICVDQSALAVSFVAHPVAFIHGAIRPDLGAFALAHVFADFPLTLVPRAVFKLENRAFLTSSKFLIERWVVVYKLA